MDENSKSPPYFDREEFSHRVLYDPLDLGLALSTELDFSTMNHKILEIYYRFWSNGHLHANGDKCFFTSYFLRRVLRLHGIEAHCKQVISYYTHLEKGWKQIIGEPMNVTHNGVVDSHCVVVTKDYILDWSVRDAIHHRYGVRAPIGFIAKNYGGEDFGKEQDFGEMGLCSWEARRNHRNTNNIIWENREAEIKFTKEYFQKYRM